MNVKFSSSRAAGLLAGVLIACTSSFASDTAKTESDALPNFADSNHITVAGIGASTSGSKAAFKRGTQLTTSAAGGIEEARYTKDLSKATAFEFDGRLLPGLEDYLAEVKVTKTDVGSFDAGYKRFRTFYDGAGGFFPGNNAFLPLYNRALYVDRGRFFATGVIALPEMPVFTFKYTNDTRTGRKDSTIWGDTDQTGIPIWSASALNPISANRKIIPAYINLDEKHEEIEFSVKHTVGKTTGSLSVVGTRGKINNRRSVDRYPGELKPYPAIPSNPAILVTPAQANNQNKGFDLQKLNEDGLTYTARIETAISDKLKVYASGLRRESGTDIENARLISAVTATKIGVQNTVGAFVTNGRPPYSYTSKGHVNETIYTGVVGLEATPLPKLNLGLAFRAEQYDAAGYNRTDYVNNLINVTTGTVTAVPVSTLNGSRISEKPVTPEINVRYSGIKNIALFANWDYRSSPGDERKSYIGISPGGNLIVPSPSRVNDNVKEKHSNLKLGANWNPCTFFTGRAEVFTKDHENRFTGYGENLGEYYILNYDISGAKLSATVKPMATLSLTSRYITQTGKARNVGDSYAETNSGRSNHYQFAETVDWTPNKSVYVQGNINVVFETIKTAYPTATLTARNVLHNADNNYWNGSIITGFVVDKNTDAQLQATYYKADNYNPALAGSTQPYGAGARDYSVTVGLKHKLTDRMLTSIKVGYLNSENETVGGYSDYKGLVGYVSLDYQL
jgi:hypothetical protein